jgi:hypothetical protein
VTTTDSISTDGKPEARELTIPWQWWTNDTFTIDGTHVSRETHPLWDETVLRLLRKTDADV